MAKEKHAVTVADMFRRAQAIRREDPQMSLKDLKRRLVEEYRGAAFPPIYSLTIPEQDSRAPEEDWSAGLSLIARGIQTENWTEIASGIVLSLEQTDRYERERGPMGSADDWHDRTVGIREPLTKGVDKWMPEELMRMAKKSTEK